MPQKKSAAAIVLAIVLLLYGPFVSADNGFPALSFKGFGTFGASGTDTNRLGFRRDTTQSNGVTRAWDIDPDSRLGLQLDAEINESWHAGAQWVARNITGNFAEQNLDWAYLRWSPADNLNLRLGRLGYDVFLLGDHRNVGYAYLWIRPPHEFYAGLPTFHFDGADISQKFLAGEGYMTLKAFGGYSAYQVPAADALVIKSASALFGASLYYELRDWSAKISYSYTHTLNEVPFNDLFAALNNPLVNLILPGAQSLAQDISIKGKAVQFSSIGLAYDDGVWLAQMEASYIDSEVISFPSVASAYLSVGRRIGKVSLYSLLGISETLNKARSIPKLRVPVPQAQPLREALDFILNANGVDEKSISFGMRWDVCEKVALKAQWSHFWLGQNGTQLWQEPSTGIIPRLNVNVWSVGIDFIF
jgi:hypothetical protein